MTILFRLTFLIMFFLQVFSRNAQSQEYDFDKLIKRETRRSIFEQVPLLEDIGAEFSVAIVTLQFPAASRLDSKKFYRISSGPLHFTVQTIRIYSKDIGEQALDHLSRFRYLKVLIVRNKSVDDRLFETLAKLNGLEQLFLRDTAVNGSGLVLVTHLPLTHLDLSYTNLSEAGINALESFPALEQLRLTGMDVDDEGLRRLSKLKKLADLDLRNTKITKIDNLFEPESGVLPLRVLGLAGTSVDDQLFDYMPRLTNLNELSVNSTKVTAKGLAKLLDMKNLKLNNLQVDRHQIDEQFIDKMKEVCPLITIEVYEKDGKIRGY